MIKGIKGGLSHARKDKIKIQFEVEFKQLNNISNDLIDQFISIKWDRGKFKGETNTFKVQKHLISPDNKMIIQQNNNNNNNNNITSSDNTPIYNSEIINNILNNKEFSQASSTGSLTKKQSKILLGNKIDGTNNMIGGDGFAAISNEKVQMKITMYSDTIHNKQDYTLQTNFEQKLLGISLQNKSHSSLVSTHLDLSNYMDCNRASLISIPFPSSTPNQTSLCISIKSKFLRYNDKKIQTFTKDYLKNLNIEINNNNNNIINNNSSSGFNKLMEIHGNIYYIIPQHHIKDHGIISNNDLDPLHSETNTYSILTDDDDEYDEDIPTEDPFIISPQKDNAIIIENQNLHSQLKDLKMKLNTKENEYKDSQRVNEFHLKEIEKLKSSIDECRMKVLEYEEHSHRAETLQKFVKNQLTLERFEFKKILESKESDNNNDSFHMSQILNKNVKLIKDNNDLIHQIEEIKQTISQKDEEILNLNIQISNLKKNNVELNCGLESQKLNYKKVLSDLTEFEFKYEKDRKLSSSVASSSPLSSPSSNRGISPILIQRKVNKDNNVNNNDNNDMVDSKEENNIQIKKIHTSNMTFLAHMKILISTQYPSVLYNPLIAWMFAIFCCLMFFYKALVGC